ncbi:phosphoenolpyruvate-utilizing N-terminal domain-containing protein [Nonomuraea antimicrobica]
MSLGRAAGPLVRMAGPPTLPQARAVTDPAAEAAEVAKSLEAVAADLNRRAAAADGPAAEILEALAMIAEDPVLLEEAEALARDGTDAAHALDTAFTRHRDTLAALGGYLAERAADLDDLRNRAVAYALGLPMPGLPAPGHPYVLVAGDLSPPTPWAWAPTYWPWSPSAAAPPATPRSWPAPRACPPWWPVPASWVSATAR